MIDDELSRALRKALAATARPMPQDLKANLKRRARGAVRPPERASYPFWGAWTLSAACAAAALLALTRFGGDVPRPTLRVAPERPAASAKAALRGLWDDDEGGESDEG
jgi:hypothetical protein